MDERGFYQKYKVERVDGRQIVGPTFTLELDHDPYAIAALEAYVKALKSGRQYPRLVNDLEVMIKRYGSEDEEGGS